MKMIKMLTVLLFAGLVTTSCKTQPGEFSHLRAEKYNFAPYSAASAWQQAHKVLGEKATIISDNSADLSLQVKFFENVVDVTFRPLSPRSCRYTVKCRDTLLPAEASVNTVYNELDRLFREK